jgi:hemerythrin-like domain-containing protein
MVRDKNLIPLSHQHQRALALCVRIERAAPIGEGDLEAWQAEIAQLYRSEITIHFAAEEQVVFPAARRFGELVPLIEELVVEHGELRKIFSLAEARRMLATDLPAFAARLSGHIRKEERVLFERMQGLMSRVELDEMGGRLAEAIQVGEQSCIVPTPATRLRAAK